MHDQDVLVTGSLLGSEYSLSDVHVSWQHCCGGINIGPCHEVPVSWKES